MKILKKVSQFKQESSGASMVEFALILPLLMIISLGIFETTNYILLSQRLNEIASGVANWVSTKTTAAQITDCLIGANLVGAEYNFSTKGAVVVTGLEQSGGNAMQLVWQKATTGATSSIITNGTGVVTSSPFAINVEQQIILVEVTYQYTPTFSYFLSIFPPVKLLRVGQMVPRSGGTFTPLPAS